MILPPLQIDFAYEAPYIDYFTLRWLDEDASVTVLAAGDSQPVYDEVNLTNPLTNCTPAHTVATTVTPAVTSDQLLEPAHPW